LITLPLSAARCGGGDDDTGPAASGTGGSAGNSSAGRAGGSGTAGLTAGGSSGKGGGGGKGAAGGKGGKGGSGAQGGAGGAAGAESGGAGEAGAATGGTGATTGSGGAGATGGSAEGGEAGASGASGEGGAAPACDYRPISRCSDDLSNIGTGDFEIALELKTTAVSGSEIVSQRPACSSGYFWDLRMGNGLLGFELDDNQQHYVGCRGTVPVNDGEKHAIVIRRENLEVSLYVDCQLDVSCAAATNVSMPLPAVEVGSNPCSNPSTTDGTIPLVGTVSGLCFGGI
jgi:hypothetical protein